MLQEDSVHSVQKIKSGTVWVIWRLMYWLYPVILAQLSIAPALIGRRFAAALLPQLFGTNPRSHHKGATSRVLSGFQLYAIANLITTPVWKQPFQATLQGRCQRANTKGGKEGFKLAINSIQFYYDVFCQLAFIIAYLSSSTHNYPCTLPKMSFIQ